MNTTERTPGPSVFLIEDFVDASLLGVRIKGAYSTFDLAREAGLRLPGHTWHVAEWHIEGTCNSHAALVEALENLLVAAREEQLAWGHTSIRTNCYLDAQKAAIEALATAKGE